MGYFDKIFTEPEYQEYLNANPDIHSKISKILESSECGLNTATLAQELVLDERYIKTTLYAWDTSWCSFFQHGRVYQNITCEKWFYIPCSHPLSKEHNISSKFIKGSAYTIVSDLEITNLRLRILELENFMLKNKQTLI